MTSLRAMIPGTASSSMKAPGARIEFRDVYKRYGNSTAVRGFDLAVEPGRFVTLLGASGSGKTTLLNILAGFIEPSSGDVLLNGQSIVSLAPESRNVGMVFQNYSLFPHMTVFENIAFPLRMRRASAGDIAKQVAAALDAVQLGFLARRMPRELSGGQQQRVAVARAISFGPRVLLMDEPLGALDLKLREALQLEIKRIQRDTGSTVVYVTHDQAEAMSMSDEIVIMRDGAMVQRGTPKDIYDHPRTRFVADFVGQCSIAEAKLTAATAEVPDWGLSIPLSAHQHRDTPGKGFAAIRPEKVAVSRAGATSGSGVATAQAAIESVQLFGNNLMIRLRLPSSAMIIAQRFRTGGDAEDDLQVGANVTVSFKSNDVFLLDE